MKTSTINAALMCGIFIALLISALGRDWPASTHFLLLAWLLAWIRNLRP